jgi:C4-dicarboxylate transporter DctM subunit
VVLAVLCLLFLLFLALGVPLTFGILLVTTATIAIFQRPYPLESIFLTFFGGIQPFEFVAIPLFIIAGNLIGVGGVGKRIVVFARTLLGFLPGGLGIVTVAASMVFGGVSGSALADTAAVGSVMIPGLTERGYRRSFAAALVATAGTLGCIVPPSIPMLVYGFVGNVSVADLFLSGLIPSVLFALAMMGVCVYVGKTSGCDTGEARSSLRDVVTSFVRCLPALLMPGVILGGIFSGLFTPTEAASVAVVYGLAVALLLYRDITWRHVPKIILDSFITSATVMLLIGATTALAYLVTIEQLPALLTALVEHVSRSPWVFLLLVNIVLLILGPFLEPVPAILLTVPLFAPAAQHFGVNPVHLGLIIVCNLAIGLHMPPVGATLFVSSKIANVGIGRVSREMVPFFAVSVVVLGLVTYIPAISMTLVSMRY